MVKNMGGSRTVTNRAEVRWKKLGGDPAEKWLSFFKDVQTTCFKFHSCLPSLPWSLQCLQPSWWYSWVHPDSGRSLGVWNNSDLITKKFEVFTASPLRFNWLCNLKFQGCWLACLFSTLSLLHFFTRTIYSWWGQKKIMMSLCIYNTTPTSPQRRSHLVSSKKPQSEAKQR